MVWLAKQAWVKMEEVTGRLHEEQETYKAQSFSRILYFQTKSRKHLLSLIPILSFVPHFWFYHLSTCPLASTIEVNEGNSDLRILNPPCYNLAPAPAVQTASQAKKQTRQ